MAQPEMQRSVNVHYRCYHGGKGVVPYAVHLILSPKLRRPTSEIDGMRGWPVRRIVGRMQDCNK